MIVVSDYRGHRIEVSAIANGERFNAEVRMRRSFSEEKPRVDTVTCFKLSAEIAEHAGETWARRWIDLKSGTGKDAASRG